TATGMAKKQRPPRRRPGPPAMPPARAPAPARALPGPLVEAVKGVVLAHLATTSGGAATFVALARAVRAAKRSGSIAIPVPERQIDAAIKALLASGVLVQAGDGTISIGRQGTPAASNPPAIAALVKEIVTTYLAEHVHATSETLATHVRDARRLGSLATSSEQVEAAIKALIDSGDVVQAGDENELFLSPALATAAGPPGPVPGMTARQYDEARRFVVRRFEDFATICTFNELVPPDDHVYFPREIYSDKALRDAVWHVLRSGGFVVEEGSCEGYSTVTTSERVAWYREQRAMIAERWLREGIPAREADAVADLEAEIAENLRVIDPAGFHAEYKPYDFKDPEEWVRLVDAFFNCHCLVENGHVVGLWISDDWTTRTPDPPNPRHMALRRIPASIGDLVHLRYLHIRNYHALAPLPASITRLVDLEVLVLGNAFEGTLPAGFGNLRRLRTLYLEGQGDPAGPGLPGSLGDLASLEHLCLRCTGALPASIGNLASLRTLTIHESSLGSLPESFGDLRGLRYLDLRGSPISPGSLASLPESFGNLASLERLDLSYNRLASLPGSFGNLRALRTLDLRDNRLATLPGSFGSLASLTTLKLMNNPLTTLPASFSNLASLDVVDIFPGAFPDIIDQVLARRQSPNLIKVLEGSNMIHGAIVFPDGITLHLSTRDDKIPVFFSPDGSTIVSAARYNHLLSWNAHTGELLEDLDLQIHEHVTLLDFSPDLSRFVTCSPDGTTRVFETRTGTLLLAMPEMWIQHTVFSPNGNMLAMVTRHGVLHLRDLSACKDKLVVNDARSPGLFSPDGTKLVVSCRPSRAWDLRSMDEIEFEPAGSDITHPVVFSADGNILVARNEKYQDMSMALWDVLTGRQIRAFKSLGYHPFIALSSDGRFLAIGCNGNIQLHDIVAGTVKTLEGGIGPVYFSPDGLSLVSCSRDMTVRLWDVRTGEQKSLFRSGPPSRFLWARFSPDGTMIATGSEDGRIRLWSVYPRES
nr:hypothetical protein [Candidatus Sigynarchaeum springense]